MEITKRKYDEIIGQTQSQIKWLESDIEKRQGKLDKLLRGNKFKSNAKATQVMISERLLQQIQQAQPEVKEIHELYYDKEDRKNYAVFSVKHDKQENLYSVAYNFDGENLTISDYAMPARLDRQYITDQPARQPPPAQHQPQTKQPSKAATPPPKGEKKMPFFKKKQPKANSQPTKLSMRTNEPNPMMDEPYDTPTYEIYDELVDLEPTEIAAGLTAYVAQYPPEEAVEYLDDLYQAAEYIQEYCSAKMDELGYEPSVYDQPDINIDTDEYIPEDVEEDIDEVVQKLNHRRQRNNKRRKKPQPVINRALAEFQKTMKEMGESPTDLVANMKNFAETNKKWRSETVTSISAANPAIKRNKLEAMDNETLVGLAQGLKLNVETPVSYALNGFQKQAEQVEPFIKQKTTLADAMKANRTGGKK